MPEKIRWGLISTGYVARQFAAALKMLPGAELVAVGSRSASSASRFADQFGIPRRYSSYEELAGDRDVDVVYIGTPHPFHKENTLLCLSAGKAVLCEKPLTVNAAEAGEVIAAARTRRLFLMEAMWSRFFPAMCRVRRLLADGVIGKVLILSSDFGFAADPDPGGRIYNPELAGGALLDIGIYPLSLSSMIFGPPARVSGMAHLGETGVDEQFGLVLGYGDGALSVSYATVKAGSPTEATLVGTLGRIHLHAEPGLFRPHRITLSLPGRAEEIIDLPFAGNGYQYEAEEVMRCLREGRLESDVMPLDESLQIMSTMDRIREQWGLRYPMEGVRRG